MTLARSLLEALRAQGAREIFGIPGDFALPFFKEIEESGILPLFTLSHEPGVGFAADAAARFGGRLSVAAVTYGAGAFNLVNAIAGAFAERVPVVVISGAPSLAERSRGLLVHHQAKSLDSQLQVFREITCDQAVLSDPQRAPAEIARVLRSCRELSAPVYLELPRDRVLAEVGPVPDLPPRGGDPAAAAECAEEVLSRLAAARAPCLVAGVEIRRYGLEAQVAELARRLGIPVVTSFMGRGLLAEAEVDLRGTYLGVAGDPAVTELVEGSDGLLLLGVLLADTNFGLSARDIDLRHAVQACEREVDIGYHSYPDLPLADLVSALIARLQPALGPAPRRAAVPEGLPDDAAALTPTDVAVAVNDLIAAAGRLPVASDMGDCLFTAMDMQHTPLVAPGYYAGMGYGVPAGIGLQLSSGERPLILVGDGAFQMTGWELGNCRRLGIDPVVLVFNNESWEMLRAFQPESRFNDLDDWRFAELAEVMGGRGRRVRTRAQLKRALAEAWAERGRFQLIEIMLQRGAMSNTLSRFASGFASKREAARG